MDIERNSGLLESANHTELLLRDAGVVWTDSSWHQEACTSPFTRLYLVSAGSGYLRVGDKEIRMCPGNIYMIPAGLCFDYGSETSVHKLFFHVNIIMTNGLEALLGLNRIGVLENQFQLIEEMMKIFDARKTSNSIRLKACIYKIISDIITECDYMPEQLPQYSKLILNTIQYIRSNLSAKLTVRSIASALFVSEGILARTFKQEVGKSVGSYIDDLLLNTSQWMLLKTEYSIGEISDKLGYCDQFYFSRRFKQLSGETPYQYRNRMRNIP